MEFSRFFSNKVRRFDFRETSNSAIINETRQTKELSTPLCAICLEILNELATIDGCSHRFCYTCICIWGGRNSQCPMCKSSFSAVEEIGGMKRKRVFESSRIHADVEEEDQEYDYDYGNDDSDLAIGAYGYVEDGFVVDDNFIEYEEEVNCNDDDESIISTSSNGDDHCIVESANENCYYRKDNKREFVILHEDAEVEKAVIIINEDDGLRIQNKENKRSRSESLEGEKAPSLDFNSLLQSFAYVEPATSN